MTRRNRTRTMLALAVMLTTLLVLPALAVAQGAEDPAFGAARESAEIAAYTISKVQRWLHEVALEKIEPDTGLYHPDGNFNYQDAWADCYPFLVWAAWLTDLDALNGPVRGALHAEIKHCEPGFFTDPKNTFGGSEYVKDGLIAIVEVTGRDEWFDRMQAIQDEIWAKPTIDTKYGKIPSTNIEVNGEQIQALARLYTMTGEKKYLRWAERLADYYLLKGDFVPGRLRDHGCEIIGGLGLLLGVESVHNPEKAKQYLPHMKKMLDTVLEKGTNADGIMHDSLGPRGRLSDGWGYNYVAYLCYDMVVGRPIYRAHMEQVLRNLAKPAYQNHPWEGNSIDGFADSVEGGIYIMNRLPIPEGLAWADREVATNIVYAQDKDKLWGTMKLQSNGVRTAIMHALMHTRGLIARPWRQDLKLGASQTKDGVAVVMKAKSEWSGKLAFDIPRHRIYMGFKHDWPRMNTMPEWFTVQPSQKYVVKNVTRGSQETYTGKQLHDGLRVELQAGQESLLLVTRTAASHAQHTPKQLPNIIVIYADDLGYGDVQCYNLQRGKVATPHIDQLAAQGLRFTDAHSSSGVCSPSRYTLLTGRYHWRSRLQRGIVGLWEAPLITPERLTIGSLAKQHAYRTACIGKWHLGWNWPIPAEKKNLFATTGYRGKKDLTATDQHRSAWREAFSQPIPDGPTAVGFDEYFGTDVPNWPPYCFIKNDRTVGIPSEYAAPQLFEKNQASQQGPALEGWTLEPILPALADRAADFIRREAKTPQPFLLYMPLTSPHTPLSVNDKWKGKSGLNLYADFVMETDAVVGRVLESLATSDAADNTLVVFTSDNGCAPYIGVNDLEKMGHYPSGPLRGYKSDAWEGGHRVPFIVRWPGVVKTDSVCDQLVHQADLMATFAAILGRKLPDNAGEDSFSLIPLLKGGNKPIREHAVSAASSGLPALRLGRWKYIPAPGSGGWGKGGDQSEPVQLYDLADDIGESKNLAATQPARVSQMQTLLETLIAQGRSTPGPTQKNDVEVRRYSPKPTKAIRK